MSFVKKNCFMKNCGNSTFACPKKLFFTVPLGNKKEWCRAAGWDYVPNYGLNICEDHLNLEEDLENYMYWKTMNGYARLKPRLPVFKHPFQQESGTSQALENVFVALEEPMPQPGASVNSSYETTLCSNQESLDCNAGFEDPLATEPPNTTPQCRFCTEYSKDCIDVTDKDRPYLTRNKTALTINDLTVELDFNDDVLPKTVCGICDRKLQAMCDFFKQVKDAQDSLINVRDNVKEDIGNLTVKTECESPTPEDDDIIDSEDGIVDSLTVCETVFVKPFTSKHKRKGVEDTPKTQKKTKVTKNAEIGSEESELIINIKEEPAELAEYEAEIIEFIDTKRTKQKTKTFETKTVTGSSELELQTRGLVTNINENIRCNK